MKNMRLQTVRINGKIYESNAEVIFLKLYIPSVIYDNLLGTYAFLGQTFSRT
jgi:hypothetical protein